MAELKTQVAVTADISGLKAGMAEAQHSLAGMAARAEMVGKKGSQALDGIGASAKQSAKEVERATRNSIASLQRDIALLEAGGDRMSRAYRESIAKQRGADVAQLEPYFKRLDELKRKQKDVLMSAGQYANAMRMVPAQITDIVTQLAGGASPGLVLLQQGGQLRDSFGGVGNMMKGLLSLISPVKVGITAVGAAVAVTAKWMYEGAQQQNAYAKALALTNNVSGATVESLQKIHKGLNQANQAYAKNHEALLLLANSGQVHASVMQDMAAGIVSYSRASGAEMKALAQDLTAVSKDPLKGIVELNDKYGILTASTYQQVQALIEQGRKQEAVNLVMREAGQEMKKLGDRAQENLGYFDRMFHSVGQAYGRLKQVIMDWGKEPVGNQRLVEIDTAIALAKREKNYKGGFDPTIDALEKKRQAIAAELREEQQLNALQANRAAANEAGIKALERFSSIKLGLLNDEEKKLKELKDLDEQRIAIRRAGLVVDEKDFAEQRKRIEAKYAPKEAKGRSEKDRGPRFSAPYNGDYRITSGIQAARLHPVLGFKRAHNGVDVAMPTGTILKAMADGIIERIANDAKGYGKYIDIRYKDGSKSRYAHMSRYADGLRVGSTVRVGQEVGRSGNTGLSSGPHAHIEFRNSSGALRDFRHMVGDKIKDGYNEIKNLAAERYQQMQEEMALLGQKTLAEQTAAEIAIGKYGELEQYEKNALINQAKLLDAKRMMLDVEQEIESSDATIRLLKLEYEYAGQSRAAIEELSRARLEDSIAERRRKAEELGGNEEVLAAYDRQAERLREIFNLKEKIAKKPIEFDWKKGVKGGLDAYLDHHRDINKQIEEATQNAFQGMEDALVSFVAKGKADFRSLAQSILADMARLTLRQTVMKPLAQLLSSAIGSMFGGAAAPSGGTVTGAGYTVGPFGVYAKGGAFTSSPSLSAYSGQIVDSPTLFKFAKGGTGLMGEAGPEAILPLKRGPGGYLGVRAETGKGGDVYVTVNAETGQTSAKGGGDADAWAQIGRMVGEKTRAIIAEEKRPGGMLA